MKVEIKHIKINNHRHLLSAEDYPDGHGLYLVERLDLKDFCLVAFEGCKSDAVFLPQQFVNLMKNSNDNNAAINSTGSMVCDTLKESGSVGEDFVLKLLAVALNPSLILNMEENKIQEQL